MKNYKKTKNFNKTSKTTPERPGTPFKRRGMQNYVLFSRNYAFTTFLAAVLFKNIGKSLKTCVFPAAGAAFLSERLPKSARIRVLMLPRERAELTDHFLNFLCIVSHTHKCVYGASPARRQCS